MVRRTLAGIAECATFDAPSLRMAVVLEARAEWIGLQWIDVELCSTQRVVRAKTGLNQLIPAAPAIGHGALFEIDGEVEHAPLVPRAIELLRVQNISHFVIDVAGCQARFSVGLATLKRDVKLQYVQIEMDKDDLLLW